MAGQRKRQRELDAIASRYGYRLDGLTGGGHLRFVGPGMTVFGPATPSDRRSVRNLEKQIARAAEEAR